MTSPDLEALRALVELAKKTTSGEWVAYAEHEDPSYQGYVVGSRDHSYAVATTGKNNEDACNADFIATARNAIPAIERLLAGQQDMSIHPNLALREALLDAKDRLEWFRDHKGMDSAAQIEWAKKALEEQP